MIPRIMHLACRCAGWGALLLCVGCGTGEYERRYEEQLKQWKTESPFVVLYGPLSVPAAGGKDATDAPLPFSIRVPKVFAASYQANSEHDEDILKDRNGRDVKDKDESVVKLISEHRLQPPMLLPPAGKPMTDADGLPGMWRCYEGKFMTKNDPREFPYYGYLACGEVDKSFPARLGMLQAKLAKALPETSKTWVNCDISGGAVSEHKEGDMKYWDDDRAVGCKRLVAKGPQHFYDRNNGHNGENRLNIIEPGTFELYLFQTSTHFLFVGWRYADAVENEIKPIKLEDLAALSLSTVRMLPVATTPTKDAAANPKGAKK